MSTISPRQIFGLFVVALAVLLSAFYLPFLTRQQAFYQSDVVFYFEPFIRFICDGYLNGRLPLWNPYLYCGMAQIAVPSPGMFYPFIVLFLWLPFSQALALCMVAHQLIAGGGTYLLIIAWGLSWPAAALAGLAVALCGYMFALQTNFTLPATVAWLPLLLLLIHKVDDSWRPRNVLKLFGISVTTAVLLAAGRPEVSAPAGVIAGAYALCTGVGAWRRLALVMVALTLGVLLCMPVIAPALEWVNVSPRSGGLAAKWVLMWSANWYDCFGLIFPQALGDLSILGHKYLNFGAARYLSLQYVQSTFVGPVVLTFALWSLFDRSWLRTKLIIVGMLAGTLIMAAGSYTPVAPFVLSLSPAFSAFRYPVKLMIFPGIALIGLAAFGMASACKKEIGKPALLFTCGLWLLVLLMGAGLALTPDVGRLYAQLPWSPKLAVDVIDGSLHLVGNSMVGTAAVGLAVCALYFAYVRFNWRSPIFECSVLLLLVINLLLPSFANLRHGAPGDFFTRRNEYAHWIRNSVTANRNLQNTRGNQTVVQRFLPLYFDPLTPGVTFLSEHKIGFQQGFYLYARQMVLPNTNLDFRIPNAFGYEAAEVGRYKELFSHAMSLSAANLKRSSLTPPFDAPIARFCELTAVELVATQLFRHRPTNILPKLNPRYFTLIREDENVNVRLYHANETFPRVYFAELLRKGTWRDFRWRVLSDGYDTMMYETFVEDEFPNDLLNEIRNGANQRTIGTPIVFEVDDPERIVMTVERPKPGLLVLSDQHYPGWVAMVDGKPTHIYRVNYFARGIIVPPGRHTVEYVYRPSSLTNGLICSAAVMLIYLILFLLSTRKGNPAPSPHSSTHQSP